MNNLMLLEEREILNKNFKIYGDVNNPLFLAKDVAEWIEHSNSRVMLSSIDDDEKVVKNVYTLGGTQESWFLTEDGLYEVLMQSRKPIAKKFKKEVKKILKEIRKNGGYILGQEELTEDELLAKALVVAQNKIAEKNNKIKSLETDLKMKEQVIGELKPKADYTDTILKNTGLVTITQIAKDYGMSGKEMNKRLHKLGVQYNQSGQWLLYSKYHNKGYTHSETIEITRSNGMKDVTMSTKWTQKGRLFLYELLKSKGYLPVIEQTE